MSTPHPYPATLLPGWRHFHDTLPDRPPALAWDEYKSLDPECCEQHDEARLHWLARGLVVRTEGHNRARILLQSALSDNRYAGKGEQGVMLVGEPKLGKTTLARSLGHALEARWSRQGLGYRELGQVPVVAVDAPSNGSGKALCTAIDAFFNPETPPATRMTFDEILRGVCHKLRAHGTQLLIIDEAQLLARRHDSHGDPTDVIKLIQNNTQATVLLSGINLLDSQVFGTRRGGQVVDRCGHVLLEPIGFSTDDASEEWDRIVNDFDVNLPLIDHEPGLLLANAKVLHEATAGRIGHLSDVIRSLVRKVLYDENRSNEKLTKTLLAEAASQHANNIPRALAAQSTLNPTRKRRKKVPTHA